MQTSNLNSLSNSISLGLSNFSNSISLLLSFEQSNWNILLRKSHDGDLAWQKPDQNLALE